MRLSLYYKGCKFTLSKKRIDCNVLALDVNIFQQRNERADLIGLLGLIAAL
jgi:hypothetical protein